MRAGWTGGDNVTLCEMPLLLPRSLMSTRTVIGLILLTLAPAEVLSAQTGATIDPTALVRRATQHRIEASQNHQPLRYLLRKTDGLHDTTKDIIETRDGDVARLVALNGQPLSAQANQAELDRLNNLANHPEIQQHRYQREQKDADRVNRLMRLLPTHFCIASKAWFPAPRGNAIA